MIKITPIPAFSDNYLWLIENTQNGQDKNDAVVVDPGDAEPVLKVLREKNLNLAGILITHHHSDHIAGIDDLLSYYDVPVYGPYSKRIPQISVELKEGDEVALFDRALTLKVLEVPGHTYDHIAYVGDINQQAALFCGDTLFAAGCGRLFDGTHEQFYRSLHKLNSLPLHTQIYCTHEYTLSNLAFAKAVEPKNKAIQGRIKNEQLKREKNQATLPTNLALERQTNPFLRYQEPGVSLAINQFWEAAWTSDLDLFTGLRRWKDKF
ncbi:MAG: hydroxyacylglutathione hydrolase [Cellvibrionaceae bacterium]|jgi:hydroxyacylglutathione hydrolase